MGRGLSELQRYILGRAEAKPRLYHAEVLAGYFGWVAVHPLRYDRHGMLTNPDNQHFSRKGIGAVKYRMTRTSLTRACQALERRGLVRCVLAGTSNWSGVEITPQGRAWLTGNRARRSPPRPGGGGLTVGPPRPAVRAGDAGHPAGPERAPHGVAAKAGPGTGAA
jgi:hypothetical protein